MDITTSWVSPPNQITGLDHLGVQAPCINIYAQLIPGITNVTDRARYYSFYPWLLLAMSEAGYSFNSEFIQGFRRADVLLTLICLRHEQVCCDGSHHSDATVGSLVLSKALHNLEALNNIRLSTYANNAVGHERYFKNPLGGLGQYYLGVLKSLNLMDGNLKSGVKTVRDIGGKLANSFANNLDVSKFLDVISKDKVTIEILDDLSGFCMCGLSSNDIEQKAMVSLLSGTGAFIGQNESTINDAITRRESLRYFLSLADSASRQGIPFNIETFRAYTYCCTLSDDDLDEDEIQSGWASYQRNELFSVALQGFFFACLKSYENSGLILSSVDELSNWFWDKGPGSSVLSQLASKDYSDVEKELLEGMPDFKKWQFELHEIQCMQQIFLLSNSNSYDDSQIVDIVIYCLRILSALSGREENVTNYSGNLFFPKGYFQYYPVNLINFHKVLGKNSGDWRALPLKQCLTRILTDWCLNAHLRVALRKLRNQSQSTFRFMPSDEGLKLLSVPKPANTQPRFKQTRSILKDIGLLEESKDGLLRPTAMGISFIKQSRLNA
eukprot:m.36515 g.36515  ORF g.36515 m.36515 type:complete len:554 (+) comp5783_c0_seq1:697-2358(+)